MSLIVSLQKLFSIGRTSSRLRPSLVAFAGSYQPQVTDPGLLAAWHKLMDHISHEMPDVVLTGLQMFLRQSKTLEEARICMSLDCEIAFEINAGTLCLDAHDGDVLCCPVNLLENELTNLIESYDLNYQ